MMIFTVNFSIWVLELVQAVLSGPFCMPLWIIILIEALSIYFGVNFVSYIFPCIPIKAIFLSLHNLTCHFSLLYSVFSGFFFTSCPCNILILHTSVGCHIYGCLNHFKQHSLIFFFFWSYPLIFSYVNLNFILVTQYKDKINGVFVRISRSILPNPHHSLLQYLLSTHWAYISCICVVLLLLSPFFWPIQ